MKVYKKIHTNFDAVKGHQKNIKENKGISDFKKEGDNYVLFYSFDPPSFSNLKELVAKKPIKVFIEKNSQNLPIEKTNIGKIPENRREGLSWKGCYYTIKPKEHFFYRDSNHYDLSHFTLNNGLDFKINTGNPLGWIIKNEITIK